MRSQLFASTLFISMLTAAACGSPFNCPTAAPADGTSCSHRAFECETGGGPHERCSTISTCSDSPTSTWSSASDATCTAANDSACAPDYNSVSVASTCPKAGLSCDYTEGRCSCVPCNPSGLNWECRAWADSIDPSCPSSRPALGSPCTTPNLICRYNNLCTVSFGPDIQCFEERWQTITGGATTCATPTCGI